MGKVKRNKKKTPKEAPKLATLTQRIRHADEGTRLATLSALVDNPKPLNAQILTAIREQLVHQNPSIAGLAEQVLIQAVGYAAPELTISWLTMAIETNRLDLIATLVEENPIVTQKLLQNDEILQKLFNLLQRSLPASARIWYSLLQDNEILWEHLDPALQAQIPTLLTPHLGTSPHIVGALLTCPQLSSELIDQCISSLQQALAPWPSTDELNEAYQLYLKEKQDADLDRQIISNQNEKKEPARLIARRLKDKDEDTEDSEMRGIETTNHEEHWNGLLADFESSFVEPLHLSLEILADMFLSEKYRDYLVQKKITAALWSHLGQQILSSTENKLMGPLLDIYGQTQLKVASCLANALSYERGWEAPATLWQDLEQAYDMIAITGENTAGREGVSLMMTAAVASRKEIRKVIEESNLRWLLRKLETEPPALVAQFVRILGSLCSQETHPEKVNEMVCRALLSASTNHTDSIDVVGEVLNMLMDIYGDDDCHPKVFDRCSVLSHFQRSLPLLKQLILSARDKEEWEEVADNSKRFIVYKKESKL